MTRTESPARIVVTALGTTALLAVTEPDALEAAERVMRAELAAIDAACSRFRPDSEISRLPAGTATPVGPLLAEAIAVALRAAEQTDGMVDPTVGHAVRRARLRPRLRRASTPTAPTRSRRRRPHPAGGASAGTVPRVVLPRGVALDLGATAKALSADRIATRAAAATGVGRAREPRRRRPGRRAPRRTTAGASRSATTTSAPSSTRSWSSASPRAASPPPAPPAAPGGAAGRTVHHIVDPRTGDVPAGRWRTVSVAAATCVDANTASTAAVVMGDAAPGWLADRRLPARLVDLDGAVTTTAGWPERRAA